MIRTLLMTLLSIVTCTSVMAQYRYTVDESVYEGLPFEMKRVETVSFPDYKVKITDFGAVGDGMTLCTDAINNAIKHVSDKGGGMVVIPAGVWLTGPIQLLSNVNLNTEQNALVCFTGDHTQYPIIENWFEGLYTKRCTPPIYAFEQTNIAVTGKGTFDGNGDTWRHVKRSKVTESQWNALVKSGGVVSGTNWFPSEGSLKGHDACKAFNVPEGMETDEDWESVRDWLRPVLINIRGCQRVLLEGVSFRNSPSWCIHPILCKDIVIDGVSVNNPWYSANGDALDLESCDGAVIVDCVYDAGDDAICIKSGKDEQGRKRGVPCQNVIAKRNTVLHGHGGFVVGSEMSGGVKNIFVDNCTFIGTDVGLRFKSTRGRGGVVENIYCSNINMTQIATDAVLFDLFYGWKDPYVSSAGGNVAVVDIPQVDETTPCFRNIWISNVKCMGARRAMYFNGLPEMRISGVTMTDVSITAKSGAMIRQTDNIYMSNVRVKADEGEAMMMQYVSNIRLDGKKRKDVGGEATSVERMK